MYIRFAPRNERYLLCVQLLRIVYLRLPNEKTRTRSPSFLSSSSSLFMRPNSADKDREAIAIELVSTCCYVPRV